MTGMFASLGHRIGAHMPTREKLESNRWIRPFAHLVLRAELWRFNRRSVPRGVALGIFIGVTIPFAHSFIAAILAFMVTANVPAAIAATWISTPFTWAIMWPMAYHIGRFLLHVDAVTAMPGMSAEGAIQALGEGRAHSHMLHQLATAGLATACGLVVEGIVLAAIGYLVTTWAWRLRVVRKRRRRLSRGHARRAQATA